MLRKIALVSTLLGIYAEPLFGSEQDLKTEINQLKTIVALQQADILELRAVLAKAGMIPNVIPGTKPTAEEVQKYCYSIKRYDFKCIECGQNLGIKNADFDKCINP